MEAIYRSRSGLIFTDSIEALYEDAKYGAFVMYNKAGEVTLNLNDCIVVFINNSKGIEDFNKFREDWCRWMGSCKDGEVGIGLSLWNEYDGYWNDPIPCNICAALSASVIYD